MANTGCEMTEMGDDSGSFTEQIANRDVVTETMIECYLDDIGRAGDEDRATALVDELLLYINRRYPDENVGEG